MREEAHLYLGETHLYLEEAPEEEHLDLVDVHLYLAGAGHICIWEPGYLYWGRGKSPPWGRNISIWRGMSLPGRGAHLYLGEAHLYLARRNISNWEKHISPW